MSSVADNIQAFKARMKKTATGGKGTMRRKKKVERKSSTNQDDKRLQATLKKLSVNSIPAIEEVNLFRSDDSVVHFANPRVQAAIAANTYVISGPSETKKIADLFPQILPQLGPENLHHLKEFASKFQAQQNGQDDEDDDDVPALVENVNFEEVANNDAPASTMKVESTQPNEEDNADAAVPALSKTVEPDPNAPSTELVESEEAVAAV